LSEDFPISVSSDQFSSPTKSPQGTLENHQERQER
jgi:hypothetical protein